LYNHVVKDEQLQDHSLHVIAELHCAHSEQYHFQSDWEHMTWSLIMIPAHTQCTCRQHSMTSLSRFIHVIVF